MKQMRSLPRLMVLPVCGLWVVCVAGANSVGSSRTEGSPAAPPAGSAPGAPAGAWGGEDSSAWSGPLAYGQAVDVNSDSATTVTLCGRSQSGRRLSFEIVSWPTHGVLGPLTDSAINVATVKYTPALGYDGADVFHFRVGYDGNWSPPAAVLVTVLRVQPGPGLQAGPNVGFDAQRNLVIGGDRVYPVGFWGLCYEPPLVPVPDWGAYAAHFNMLTGGVARTELLAALEEFGILLQAQGGLTYAPQEQEKAHSPFDVGRIVAARGRRNVIAWEVVHEPDLYDGADPRSNVPAQASAIRATDPWRRPVLVSPSPWAGDFFGQCAAATDYAAVQYAPVPFFALKSVADHIENIKNKWRAEQDVDEPFVFVCGVEGYQPGRYRLSQREPTEAEVRAAGYLAALHGANGVSWNSFSRGLDALDRKPFEPWDAFYRVTDSPWFYTSLRRIGTDLQVAARLFLSAPTEITALSSDPDVHCGVFDVNGELPGGTYLVCVNVADEPAPRFEYVVGEAAERIRAYGRGTQGEYVPLTECNDGIDNDGDGLTDDPSECFGPEDEREGEPPLASYQITLQPAKIYLNHLHAGIRNSPVFLDRVHISFGAGSPAGSKFQFAIYADHHRDLSPGELIYSDQVWYTVPSFASYVPCVVAPSLRLENTREYFLAVRVNKVGVRSAVQDVRDGCRLRPGVDVFDGPDPTSLPFPSTFPALHAGREVTTTITLSGATFTEYCAARRLCDLSCWPGPVINNQIIDSFGPYAVHIYQLLP